MEERGSASDCTFTSLCQHLRLTIGTWTDGVVCWERSVGSVKLTILQCPQKCWGDMASRVMAGDRTGCVSYSGSCSCLRPWMPYSSCQVWFAGEGKLRYVVGKQWIDQ